EPGRADSLCERIAQTVSGDQQIQCHAILPSDFAEAIVVLERRRREARDGQGTASEASLFDEADIVFLDYDLVRLADVEARVAGSESGELVAYLARCYSRCGII